MPHITITPHITRMSADTLGADAERYLSYLSPHEIELTPGALGELRTELVEQLREWIDNNQHLDSEVLQDGIRDSEHLHESIDDITAQHDTHAAQMGGAHS